MSLERTLAIIKPDALNRVSGKIIDRIEYEGFSIVSSYIIHMTLSQAGGFYAEHAARPFFQELTECMSSGPSMVIVLERENAVLKWREIMGATNPDNADEGTLRKMYAIDLSRNSVHGSDSKISADREINYFFKGIDLI